MLVIPDKPPIDPPRLPGETADEHSRRCAGELAHNAILRAERDAMRRYKRNPRIAALLGPDVVARRDEEERLESLFCAIIPEAIRRIELPSASNGSGERSFHEYLDQLGIDLAWMAYGFTNDPGEVHYDALSAHERTQWIVAGRRLLPGKRWQAMKEKRLAIQALFPNSIWLRPSLDSFRAAYRAAPSAAKWTIKTHAAAREYEDGPFLRWLMTQFGIDLAWRVLARRKPGGQA